MIVKADADLEFDPDRGPRSVDDCLKEIAIVKEVIVEGTKEEDLDTVKEDDLVGATFELAGEQDKFDKVYTDSFNHDKQDDGWEAPYPSAEHPQVGTPKMWNASDSPASTFNKENCNKWGRIWTDHPSDVKLDVEDVFKFFDARDLTKDGSLICSNRLCEPDYEGFGWWRFAVKPTPEEAELWEPVLEKVNEYWNQYDDDDSRYVLGFHGTKFYAAPNILRDGIN